MQTNPRIGKPDGSLFGKVKQDVANGDAAVRAKEQENRAQVGRQAHAGMAAGRAAQLDAAVKDMNSRAENAGLVQKAGEGGQVVLNSIRRAIDTSVQGNSGLVAGITAFGHSISQSFSDMANGKDVNIHDALSNAFGAFIDAGGRDIGKAMEATYQGFYQYAKDQGLTDAQARFYADQSMEPLGTAIKDRMEQVGLDPVAFMGTYTADISNARQAVADELAPLYRNQDGTTNTDKLADATQAIETSIQKAATQGNGAYLGGVIHYDSVAGIGGGPRMPNMPSGQTVTSSGREPAGAGVASREEAGTRPTAERGGEHGGDNRPSGPELARGMTGGGSRSS